MRNFIEGVKRHAKKIVLCTTALGVSVAVMAATPTYLTKSAGGNATTGATVIFPADPQQQIRIVSINWKSDSNSAVLNCYSGGARYRTLTTNGATATNIVVNTTNGMTIGDLIVLQTASNSVHYATLAAFGSGDTNISLTGGGSGFNNWVATNDAIFDMGSATALPIGNTTNWQSGEAIYVGNDRRPVLLQLTPAASSNRINSAVARYE